MRCRQSGQFLLGHARHQSGYVHHPLPGSSCLTCGGVSGRTDHGHFSRWGRRVRSEYPVYFGRNATMSAAKRRGSAGMDRTSNAARILPQAVSPDFSYSWPGADRNGVVTHPVAVVSPAGASLDAPNGAQRRGTPPGTSPSPPKRLGTPTSVGTRGPRGPRNGSRQSRSRASTLRTPG